jgi:hypothetical protein
MYIDRMVGVKLTNSKLECGNCGNELGMKITYAKENRPAYRLFQSSVNKKIVKQAAAK